jgi:hypothetical protein
VPYHALRQSLNRDYPANGLGQNADTPIMLRVCPSRRSSRERIACVRDFPSAGWDPKPIAPTAIIALYDSFASVLPAIAAEAD